MCFVYKYFSNTIHVSSFRNYKNSFVYFVQTCNLHLHWVKTFYYFYLFYISLKTTYLTCTSSWGWGHKKTQFWYIKKIAVLGLLPKFFDIFGRILAILEVFGQFRWFWNFPLICTTYFLTSTSSWDEATTKSTTITTPSSSQQQITKPRGGSLLFL